MHPDEDMRCWVDASARLHSTVVIADGMKYSKDRDGHPVHHKHLGSVVIGKNVYIGPHTVVHRSRLQGKPTMIGDYVQIGSLNNIGHHVEIGENTLVTQGVCVGGSTRLGKNCFVGMNVTILQHLEICDGVFIGAGSVVSRNITYPGVYFGTPARYRRAWDGKW